MANGHIPGRVNPWQQIGQTLVERQQQGLQAIQSILQGRVPQLPGLPAGGWTPDIGAHRQFIDAALSVLRDNPMTDMTAFEQAFVNPLLTSSMPGQLLALDYYRRKADITGQLGNLPQAFGAVSPASHIDVIMAQSEALRQLAQMFPTNPQVAEMVRNFVTTLAPSGQAAGLPTAALAALADPYLTVVSQFGSPEAAGLPVIQFPTNTQGIPADRRRVIEGIAQAMLGIGGQTVTPFGLQQELPTSALRSLVEAGLEVLRDVPGWNFGQPIESVTPPATGTRAQETQSGLIGRLLQSVREWRSQYTELQPLVQVLLDAYRSAGFSPFDLERDLVRNRDQFVREIGEERFKRLLEMIRVLAM